MASTDAVPQHPNEASVQRKLEILLDVGIKTRDDGAGRAKALYPAERLMASWLLLVRVDDQTLSGIFQRHGTRLTHFALQFFNHNELSTKLEGRLQSLFLSLICHVLDRVPASSLSSSFRNGLLDAWKRGAQAHSSSKSFWQTHCHIVQLVEKWISELSAASGVAATNASSSSSGGSNNDSATNNESSNINISMQCQAWTETIWETFSTHLSNFKHVGSQKQEAAGDADINASGTAESDDTKSSQKAENAPDADWVFVCDTLDGLLCTSKDDAEQHDDFVKHIFLLLQGQSGALVTPTLIVSIAKWMASKSASQLSDKETRTLWNEWLLHVSQHLLQLSPEFRMKYVEDSAFSSCFNKILLAQVVSPEKSHSRLRALAWSTLVLTITQCGWDWMLMRSTNRSSSSSSRLGPAVNICTWARLASGEWRISLQSLDEVATDHVGGMDNGVYAPGLSCAQLMIGLVQYLVDMEEQQNSSAAHFDHNALFHIQKSFIDSLRSTAEYLLLYRASPGRQAAERKYFIMSSQLFSVVLQEIDIWEDGKSQPEPSKPGDHLAHDKVIECMEYLLDELNDPRLLPGVASIMAGAEGFPDRTQALAPLWEPLSNFLVIFWQRNPVGPDAPSDSAIYWGYSCTEMWQASDSDYRSKARPVALAIVQFVQGLIMKASVPSAAEASDSSKLRSQISSIVGCYMALEQGREEAPTEHEKRVILRALQYCQT